MQKKLILFLLTGLVFLFISCLHDCTPEEYKVQGKYIKNFPEWTKDILVSEWKPWNTEATVEFKKLFKQKESLNSGNINYRLFVTGQNLVLFFDDEERTSCNPLWIWVSEYEIGANSIYITQENDNEFIFTGHAKSNHFEKNTKQNRAYVEIKLLDKETYECSYLLKVNDVEIINEKMTAKFDESVEIHYTDLMDIFGYTDKEKKHSVSLKFYAPAKLSLIGNYDDRFFTKEFLYFEGISKLDYDNDSKTLTYELLGGTENMCRYMDIQFVSKDEINCLFYDLIDGNKEIRYKEPFN
ncbi:hypothetical protein [Treponema sp.]|uniref:hypothetical protein n=1 Tax=Treponema sp. TaxID=166 RepID=UPI003FD8DEF2